MKPSKKELKFSMLMSSITTFVATFAIVAVNNGFSSNFLMIWLRSWFLAFVIVSFSILFVAPRIRQFLEL